MTVPSAQSTFDENAKQECEQESRFTGQEEARIFLDGNRNAGSPMTFSQQPVCRLLHGLLQAFAAGINHLVVHGRALPRN